MIDLDQTVREYWRQRLETHNQDDYRGRPLVKMPEDLRTYERIIERTRPNTIIELGTYLGGSALWFRDRLRLFSGPDIEVVTVDLETRCEAFSPNDRVTMLAGMDLTYPTTQQRVADLVRGRRVMVVDDSAHTYDVTLKALRGYAGLVSSGCYFVVEDGVVDEPELSIWANNGGVQPAVVDFLGEEPRFDRQWLEPFGLTSNFGGWLYATSAA